MVTKLLDSGVLERNVLVLATSATNRVVAVWESIAEMVLEWDHPNYTNIISKDIYRKANTLCVCFETRNANVHEH